MSTPKIRTAKPVLILLYGFPGSGKTHFARNFNESFDCAHVQGDRIRNELFEDPRYDAQENAIVSQLMNYMTEEFLQAGVSVVYDTNAMRKTQRHALRELARKKKAKTLLVWFQVDAETSYKRLAGRDRRKSDDKYAVEYSKEDFRQYAARMQHPEQTEEYVVVSGKHTFNSQKSAVYKKLVDMGLVDYSEVKDSVAKPGLVNLIPKNFSGRVDMSRRNINIH